MATDAFATARLALGGALMASALVGVLGGHDADKVIAGLLGGLVVVVVEYKKQKKID